VEETALSTEEMAAVEEETILLARVQAEISRHVAQHIKLAKFDDDLVALRDQLAEARAEDHAALVEHMTRLAALRAAQDRDLEEAADPLNPYFAHLRLRENIAGTGLRERDVLVGRRAYIDTKAGVSVVDWRNSPVSRIYYCYEQGDEFEEVFAGERRTGVVLLRRTLTVSRGHLVRLRAGEQVLVKRAEGWERLAADRSQLAGGAGVALRAPAERFGRVGPDQRLPEITALIDPEQFRAITAERSGVVVIRGGAGTGKTTIALHRVAFLHFQDRRRYAPKRILVITPGDALRRYVGRVLPALDVRGVGVHTFPRWAMDIIKRLAPRARKRKLTDETPSGAQRLKRHPAMLRMLEQSVAEEARAYDDVFEAAGGAALLDAWVRRRNLPVMKRLEAVSKWATGTGKAEIGDRHFVVRKALRRARNELGDPIESWASLLTDRSRLERAFEGAADPPYDWELNQLIETVSAQSDDPADLAAVDHAFRTGIDGRSIADGEIHGRLDTDDLSILLRLCQLKYGRLSGPSGQSVAYEHVVVDEAQDLSPLTIKVLCDAVRPGGPVTLAGDTAQRLALDSGFGDWDELVSDLKLKAHVLPPLAISYRSTRQIMELARYALGPLAAKLDVRDARDGAPVELMPFDETGEAVAFLADALKSLRNRERKSSVAVVARSPAVAELYYRGLKRAEVPDLRRVRNQEFEFTPGIDVTDVYQVKGLEYDYVVVLETTAEQWPATLEARHLFHVAATRAAYQLWMVTSAPPSPLLLPALVESATAQAR